MVVTSKKGLHTVQCGDVQLTHQGGKKEAIALAMKAVGLRAITSTDSSTEVSATLRGRRVKRIYYGYTRTVSIELFKKEIL